MRVKSVFYFFVLSLPFSSIAQIKANLPLPAQQKKSARSAPVQVTPKIETHFGSLDIKVDIEVNIDAPFKNKRFTQVIVPDSIIHLIIPAGDQIILIKSTLYGCPDTEIIIHIDPALGQQVLLIKRKQAFHSCACKDLSDDSSARLLFALNNPAIKFCQNCRQDENWFKQNNIDFEKHIEETGSKAITGEQLYNTASKEEKHQLEIAAYICNN